MVEQNSLGRERVLGVEEAQPVFNIDNRQYFMRTDLRVNVLEWNGSMAGIYIQHPLNPKEARIYGPALEDGDAQKAVNSLFADLASRHHSLCKQGAGLKEAEKSELVSLSGLFRVLDF